MLLLLEFDDNDDEVKDEDEAGEDVDVVESMGGADGSEDEDDEKEDVVAERLRPRVGMEVD